MNTYINEDEKLKHPYYKLMELSGDNLMLELNSWSREELIEWLCWNDRNGVYKDEDSLREFDNILGKEEAIEIITRQITEA
jgi:isopentenyl phosphate kinase